MMLNYGISSAYATKREYGLHEGTDYISNLGKKAPIINMYDSILWNIFYAERSSGYTINTMTNPRFLKGVDAPVMIDYCHLNNYSDIVLSTQELKGSVNRLLKKGVELGKMGNTGFCMTFEKGKWRRITGEEQADPDFSKGVHLHYQVRLLKESDAIALRDAAISLGIRAETYFFKQWNMYYFNSHVFEDYVSNLININK